MDKTTSGTTPRHNRVICIPFSPSVKDYIKTVYDHVKFRASLDAMIKQFPELYPAEITAGYRMKDIKESKKLSIPIRRIEISGVSHTIRPSFVMPYMTGFVKDVEKGLFLRKHDVPFWGISYVLGRNAMYWYRIEKSLGRNSLVGTTIRNPEDLPEHLIADEKHTRILGEKVYVATTVGNGCVLGTSVATDAGEESLTTAYGVFKDEAQCVKPDYAPKTVNTDGWIATQNAWKTIFPYVFLIACFLHVYIKIRDRSKNKFKDIYEQVVSKLWDCYHAENKASFSQRVRRLYEWGKKTSIPSFMMGKIEKLRNNIASFSIAYDFPGSHRTSNMLDRLMQRMDRHLFSTQYFHGSLSSAELSIRGWALILNFAPSNPTTIKKHNGSQSPAERLNQFRYHDNWLQNLLISASLGGYRSPPHNPL